jgi:hypothetical protein
MTTMKGTTTTERKPAPVSALEKDAIDVGASTWSVLDVPPSAKLLGRSSLGP